MIKIFFLGVLLTPSLLASTPQKGQAVEVMTSFDVVVGDRNELHALRGQGFDCDLLAISSAERISLQEGEKLEVSRFNSWKTDWYGAPLIHADIELSSDRFKSEGIRMMISCDGSIKTPSAEEITSENLNEKLQGKFLFK